MVRRFGRKELENFLIAIDGALKNPCRIIVIGGAALELGYKTHQATRDVDLWNDPGKSFWDACIQAKAKLDVPIAKAGIAEAPYDFEDRLQPVSLSELKRLKVFVPERHDLAMLKTARGEAQDLDALEELHRHFPLALPVLIERFRETLPQVMGPPSRFELNFLALVARLYGERKAKEVEKAL
jgi:hypothetical protein